MTHQLANFVSHSLKLDYIPFRVSKFYLAGANITACTIIEGRSVWFQNGNSSIFISIVKYVIRVYVRFDYATQFDLEIITRWRPIILWKFERRDVRVSIDFTWCYYYACTKITFRATHTRYLRVFADLFEDFSTFLNTDRCSKKEWQMESSEFQK